MPAVPSNKLQSRLNQHQLESVRADPWARRKVLGVILEVYDRATLDKNTPKKVALRLTDAPGLVMVLVKLLNGKEVCVPLGISADERNLLYGNNQNMKGRPVEIEYFSKQIEAGHANLRMDKLNPGVHEADVLNPFNISGAL